MNRDLNDIIEELHLVISERDAVKAEIRQLQPQLSEAKVKVLKQKMHNKALNNYVNVVKVWFPTDLPGCSRVLGLVGNNNLSLFALLTA